MSPIKKEHRSRYPANWKEIRARILERAKNRCELCAAPNSELIMRKASNPAQYEEIGPPSRDGWESGATFTHLKPIIVVLTIAHLDPTYSSSDEKHMLALCQRCHLKIDAHLHHVERGKKKRSEAGHE